MKFLNIWTQLLCRPCLIDPAMHKVLCQIVADHSDGTAHLVDGRASLWGTNVEEIQGIVPEPEEIFTRIGSVAKIDVAGVIGKGVGGLERMSGVTDVDDISQAVDKAVSDETIQGILLAVNSPGGGITGVPELGSVVAGANAVKPVVAFTDQIMASAAYWIAAGASEIVASQSASSGSVGVYMAWLDSSRALELEGYKMELIKRGRFKAMGLEGTSLTDEQRAHLDASVAMVYGWFVAHVRDNRNVVPDALEGQSFYGEEAVAAGIVDKVGSADDALTDLLEMIELRNAR